MDHPIPWHQLHSTPDNLFLQASLAVILELRTMRILICDKCGHESGRSETYELMENLSPPVSCAQCKEALGPKAIIRILIDGREYPRDLLPSGQGPLDVFLQDWPGMNNSRCCNCASEYPGRMNLKNGRCSQGPATCSHKMCENCSVLTVDRDEAERENTLASWTWKKIIDGALIECIACCECKGINYLDGTCITPDGDIGYDETSLGFTQTLWVATKRVIRKSCPYHAADQEGHDYCILCIVHARILQVGSEPRWQTAFLEVIRTLDYRCGIASRTFYYLKPPEPPELSAAVSQRAIEFQDSLNMD